MNSLQKEYTILKKQIGQTVGSSGWVSISQERINEFAKVTEDHQFIHLDPEKAKQLSPFGNTIAHGFLVLSFASKFAIEVLPETSLKTIRINYGFNKVRFIHPVFVNSSIRGTFVLNHFEEKGRNGLLQNFELTIEIMDSDKPALVAEWLTLTKSNE